MPRYKQIILVILFAFFVLFILTSYGDAAASSAVQIGKVDAVKRMMQGNDTIRVLRIDDPENPFISIYVTHLKSGKILAAADPSNTAIACRLTGKVPEDPKDIVTTTNLDIGHFRRSIGTKVMRIARFYDKKKNVMVYLVYTNKAIGGSLKHSLSVVPLGIPLAP